MSLLKESVKKKGGGEGGGGGAPSGGGSPKGKAAPEGGGAGRAGYGPRHGPGIFWHGSGTDQARRAARPRGGFRDPFYHLKNPLAKRY